MWDMRPRKILVVSVPVIVLDPLQGNHRSRPVPPALPTTVFR